MAIEDEQYTQAASAFLGTLQSASAFDRIVGDMLPIPLRARFALITASGSASVIGQGQIKQVTSIEFSSDVARESKVVGLCVLSRELARLGGAAGETAAAIVQTELTKAVALETNKEFIRGITADATPLTASGINSYGARRDVGRALAAMTLSGSSKLYILAAPAMVAALASQSDNAGNSAWPNLSPMGGTMLGIPVVPCSACASDEITVLDAAQCVGSVGVLDVRQGSEGDMVLDTAPDSPATASTVIIPLWQRNLGAVLVERLFTVELLVSTGCQVIDSSAYGNSPAPS